MKKSSAVAPRIKSSPAANGGRATMGQTRADVALGSLIKDVLASCPSGKKVLVIDVGGTSVKILASGQTEIRSFRSGPTLTPGRMLSGVKSLPRTGCMKWCPSATPARFWAGGQLRTPRI